jgi:hypothetical protein
MTMLAEVVDAVVGGDTHRDTHTLEMLAPNGTTIATLAISNDDGGFAEAIAWIAEHAPGPRIAVGLEERGATASGWHAPRVGRAPGGRGGAAAARGPPPRQVRSDRRAPGSTAGAPHVS